MCAEALAAPKKKGGENLKIRIELGDADEIVIRCRERTERTEHLQEAIESTLRGEDEIELTEGSTSHFLPKNKILFFDSADGKVRAHTADCVYVAHYKLFELEKLLPTFFVRISKSTIVNINHISSMRRELVGNGELTFRDCDKKVYFSRSYYKLLQYKIEEMRFQK